MFERFSGRAIKVIMYAQEEARRLGYNFVDTEAILIGLIRERTGIASKALRSMGVSLQDVRVEVEKIVGRGSDDISVETIPFMPRAKRAFEASLEESKASGHAYIGTAHLLLGLIREADESDTEGVASKVLRINNVDRKALKCKVLELSNETKLAQPHYLFEQLTESALNAIVFAQEEARRLGRYSVSAEAILIGLLLEKTGIAAQALESKGLNLQNARVEVEKINKLIGLGAGEFGPEIRLSSQSKYLLQLSWEEAKAMGSASVGTEHLLLGLIKDIEESENEGAAARVFQVNNVDLNALRAELLQSNET